jgi:hypothetical protein
MLTDEMTIRVDSAGANAALASVGAGMKVRLLGIHRRGSARQMAL